VMERAQGAVDQGGTDSWMVDVNGVRLRVAVRRGSPTCTPLLLANGFGAALETFEPLIEHLDPDATVIRFDMPGIGGSPLPRRPYRLPQMARTLARLLDLLGCAQVDVLGMSWGGALAQQFAFTEQARCRRLVLVATAPGFTAVPPRPSVVAAMLSPRRYCDRRYMLQTAPDIYGGSVRADPGKLAPLVMTFSNGGRTVGYVHQVLATWGWTSLPFLPFLRQRTLVIAGDDDRLVPGVNGRILARLIRDSELFIYPGGHVELVVAPRLLTPRINAFLSAPRHSGATATER
jgi:poly(3-hydroxyalkanoate) depolymerase